MSEFAETTFICKLFNKGTCKFEKQSEHTDKGVTYQHYCSYYYSSDGKEYDHPPKKSYGREIQVRDYSSGYTLPDFKLSFKQVKVNKDMDCKTSTWFANSIRNQDINVNINTKNQNIIQESAAKYDYKSAIDRKKMFI